MMHSMSIITTRHVTLVMAIGGCAAGACPRRGGRSNAREPAASRRVGRLSVDRQALVSESSTVNHPPAGEHRRASEIGVVLRSGKRVGLGDDARAIESG